MSEPVTLTCPHCRASLSHEDDWPDVVAACKSCGGVWLDNSATRSLLENADPAMVELSRSVSDSAPAPSADTGAHRPCAKCSHPMVMTAISGTDVQVDLCSEHGTWFDRNELEHLAQALSAGAKVGGEDVPVSEKPADGTQVLRWVVREIRGLSDRRS